MARKCDRQTDGRTDRQLPSLAIARCNRFKRAQKSIVLVKSVHFRIVTGSGVASYMGHWGTRPLEFQQFHF